MLVKPSRARDVKNVTDWTVRGMLRAAVTGWLLLSGVRCAQAVAGSNKTRMAMASFMLASIAPVGDIVKHESQGSPWV
jgi:hypothetical protein